MSETDDEARREATHRAYLLGINEQSPDFTRIISLVLEHPRYWTPTRLKDALGLYQHRNLDRS